MRYTLKTSNLDDIKAGNRFYILNRGYNTGKPSKTPFVNCFAVDCENTQDLEFLYGVFFICWFNGIFKTFLIGSVIQYVRKKQIVKIIDLIINNIDSANLKTVASASFALCKFKENEKIRIDLLEKLTKAKFNQILTQNDICNKLRRIQ